MKNLKNKCPIKIKVCKNIHCVKYSGDSGFICAGVLRKASCGGIDVVRLCNMNSKGKGNFADVTPDEAVVICGNLSLALNDYFFSNKKYIKWRLKK